MSLTIFRASAGSGKTYTLAREYLKLALQSPDYYKKILAVTFTNRAAEEMKERVLAFLIALAEGTHELAPDLAEALEVSEDEVQKKAQETLSYLLHHYGYFNITTIDTFFHRVIRSFSREIGLQGSFGIELDTDKVAEFITSDVYEGVEDNAHLKEWLVDYSMSKVHDGKGYEYKGEVASLAKQLFSESFKRLPKSELDSGQIKESIKSLKQRLTKTVHAYEEGLINIAGQFDDKMEHAGLVVEELSGGKTRSIGFFFKKLKEKKYDKLVNATVEKCRQDPAAWATKTSRKKDLIIQQASSYFIPLMEDALAFIEEKSSDYYTAKAVMKHLYTLGLMTDLSRRLQEYKREEEVIMISDLPDFLNQIIDDTGSPFIYEKVGNRYSHFLIDEFQDTSMLQWENFKPLLEESLSSGNENIIVGDAKQSIYGWRGGDPYILLKGIEKAFPGYSKTHSNNTNWRSAKNIVSFNNKLFSALPALMTELMDEAIGDDEREIIKSTYEEVAQQVVGKHEDQEGVVHVQFIESMTGEKWSEVSIEHTIAIIESLLAEGHQLNDMAILVRTNFEAAQIVNYVMDYRKRKNTKVEVISAEGMLLNNSSVVQLLLSAFRHLLNPNDGSIRADLVFRYQQDSLGNEFSSHEQFARLAANGLPSAFEKYKGHLLHLPILELTEVLIRTFGLDKSSNEYAYLQAFQDAVLEFSKNSRSDIRLFLEWWEDYGAKRSVQLTGALDAIEVITSHKAKGLQYPIVFVPFCNFKFDSQLHPSWYKAPPEMEGDEIGAIPVDYKSELSKTYFSSNYKQEHAKWHLESLNVMYVAFTRAENGLYIFCDPNDRASAYGSASKLLKAYFQKENPDGWSEAAMTYKKGALTLKHRAAQGTIHSLSHYPSYRWSKKLSIRKTGKAYYDDDNQRDEGVLLHQILSEIIHWKQTDDVLSAYEKRMEITADDRDSYGTLIHQLWKNETIKSWFDGKYEVKTEVVVLPKDGESKRMDRVLIDGDQATVIDFKSGSAKSADIKQVKAYKRLLSEMGYTASGYLLYIKTGELKAV